MDTSAVSSQDTRTAAELTGSAGPVALDTRATS